MTDKKFQAALEEAMRLLYVAKYNEAAKIFANISRYVRSMKRKPTRGSIAKSTDSGRSKRDGTDKEISPEEVEPLADRD